MIMGQTNANTGISNLRSSEGLLSFIENKGQSMDLGSASITMADFDAMVKSLDKYRGAKEMALYAGIDLSLDIAEKLLSKELADKSKQVENIQDILDKTKLN